MRICVRWELTTHGMEGSFFDYFLPARKIGKNEYQVKHDFQADKHISEISHK